MASTTELITANPTPPEAAAVKTGKDEAIELHKLSSPGHTLQDLPGPGSRNVVEIQQTWKYPRINAWRLGTIFFAFVNFGMNDACYGALIPFIEQDYGLNYTIAALIFLTPFAGYTLAAIVSDRMHVKFGRRGMACIGPIIKLAAYIVISTHPPFPAVAAVLTLVGVSNGILDGAWNAWISQFPSTNELLGLLHGCYGLGATISPVIVTSMVTKYNRGWWEFFYLMSALIAVEAIVCTWAFWEETGKKYRDVNSDEEGEKTGMFRKALKLRVTWTVAAFLLVYMGAEVSIGGWIVTFMLKVRDGAPFSSGLTATGFWLGFTIGRVILGFVTPRIGERLAVTIYGVIALALELVFWLAPQFYVSAVAIGLIGFFIGPFYPAAIIAAAKLLPSELHVAAIGFASAFGGSGAALIPFAVGAIAQAKGVSTLQPIILAFLVILLGIWLSLPRLPKHMHQS